MKNLYKKIILLSALLPITSFAQLDETEDLLTRFGDLVGLAIPIVFSLALLYFFWGVAKYVLAEGQGKDDGRRIMIWGIVALFVISSVWGLVEFLQGELFTTTPTTDIDVPTINGGTGGSSGGGGGTRI